MERSDMVGSWVIVNGARVDVTVNGIPGTISGARNKFATVRSREGHAAEFAWETVERILTRDKNPGAFRI